MEENMEIKEINLSQRRLIRYFLDDDRERVGNIFLELRPLPRDIPELDRNYYDVRADNLVVLFKCNGAPEEKSLSEDVSLFIEPVNGRIAGVKVSGVRRRGLKSLTVAITASLGGYVDALRANIGKTKDWEEKLKRAGRLDVEKRKLTFFVNEIPKVLTQVAGA